MIKFKLLILIFILFAGCKSKTKYCNCNITYSNEIANDDYFSDIELSKIRYMSDSLEVSGFITKPKNLKNSNKKLPLIIYNRGGNRDFGSIIGNKTRYLKYLSSLGYVVMASQYRGNSFSEGVDEFGGKELNDIKCLIEIAKKKKYIDVNNIGVLGYSRGGLMSYLLSKDTDDINTIVTVGAPTNMFLSSKSRPMLYSNVFYELIGDSINKKQDFINRSPIYWHDKINEPALIIHGTNDKKVSIEHSLKLMDSLKNNKYGITSFFIEGGNHSISNYRKVRNDTIEKWFEFYLKK